MNPDEMKLVLKGREWVNPNMPNYNDQYKDKVHTIVQ
jgi:hypothetical protein